MPSTREQFWEASRFAVIGDSRGKRKFPGMTYAGLKKSGKMVYPVDPAGTPVAGDQVYADLASLPGPVDAAVLEVPKEETAAWVARVADAGIKNLWIHMGTETPEALALAKERGLRVESGTCAAMYVTPGFTPHTIHKWIMKLTRGY